MEATVLLIFVTLIFSAFFSGSEVAILSVTHIKAKQFASQRLPRSKSLLYLKEHQSETLITILIGNNIVNILGAVLATKFTIDTFGDVYLGAATGIMTFLTLTFGEIMPKIFASKNTTKIALLVSPIILFLSKLLFPVVFFFSKLSSIFQRAIKSDSKEPLVTEREIKYLVKVGEEEGEINSREKDIITNAFKFNDIRVKDIMTKRENVFMLDWKTSVREASPMFYEHAFSRIPVYEKDINHVKGIIRVQDVIGVLLRNEGDKTLKSLVEYTVFIHPDRKIDYALKMMQLRHVHMAIVISKKRKFLGIVTMEDILEELVGEIFDESDRVDYLIKKIGKKEWLVSTRVEIRALNKRLGLHMPITDNFKTLATFLKEKIENPKLKSEFYYRKDRAVFIVRRMFENNIHQVLIRKKR
ncbi:MAG: hemolysin family protein [Candidatus Woesearchaeota archaeon]